MPILHLSLLALVFGGLMAIGLEPFFSHAYLGGGPHKFIPFYSVANVLEMIWFEAIMLGIILFWFGLMWIAWHEARQLPNLFVRISLCLTLAILFMGVHGITASFWFQTYALEQPLYHSALANQLGLSPLETYGLNYTYSLRSLPMLSFAQWLLIGGGLGAIIFVVQGLVVRQSFQVQILKLVAFMLIFAAFWTYSKDFDRLLYLGLIHTPFNSDPGLTPLQVTQATVLWWVYFSLFFWIAAMVVRITRRT